MKETIKRIVKNLLRYDPLSETAAVREAIAAVNVGRLPYCPPDEGDLLFSVIREGGFRRCLETGFHTGSTALYLATAVTDRDGSVTSICVDDEKTVERGMQLLRKLGVENRHTLILQNSNCALSRLFLSGDRFDFIFMDGWKTFDHLAFEMYLFNQLLVPGGVIAVDDAGMPSVRRALRLLKRYYGYEEIDYAAHRQPLRLRLFHCLVHRSPRRPYRAMRKTRATEEQAPFRDWHFDRRI